MIAFLIHLWTKTSKKQVFSIILKTDYFDK